MSIISKTKCIICDKKLVLTNYYEYITYNCPNKKYSYFEYYVHCDLKNNPQFAFIIIDNNRYGVKITENNFHNCFINGNIMVNPNIGQNRFIVNNIQHKTPESLKDLQKIHRYITLLS